MITKILFESVRKFRTFTDLSMLVDTEGPDLYKCA